MVFEISLASFLASTDVQNIKPANNPMLKDSLKMNRKGIDKKNEKDHITNEMSPNANIKSKNTKTVMKIVIVININI
jgi:sortase (surface protein transpeptidase)